MADLAQSPVLELENPGALNPPRHAVLVRITHWIQTFSFLALLVSGAAILIAHPRLYWGETGAFESPALINLPLPLNLDQSGWGRSLHFLGAWVCVLNAIVYAAWGLLMGHFRSNLLPDRVGFRWPLILQQTRTYNVVQRLTYLAVIFVLFPLMILTGLAMSPAVMAALPAIVGMFGGYQSARTVHFFVMDFLLLFLIVHIAMVWLAGFNERMRGMITGRASGSVTSAPFARETEHP